MTHYVIIQYTCLSITLNSSAAEHRMVRGFCAALPLFNFLLAFPNQRPFDGSTYV